MQTRKKGAAKNAAGDRANPKTSRSSRRAAQSTVSEKKVTDLKTVGRPLPALPPPHPVPAPPPPPPQPVPAPAGCLCSCGVVVAETMTQKGHLFNALRYLFGCFSTTDCSKPCMGCCCGKVVHNEYDNRSIHHHYHCNHRPVEGPEVSHDGLIACTEVSRVRHSGSIARSEAPRRCHDGSRPRGVKCPDCRGPKCRGCRRGT